jgi:hypothetical protein
MRSHSQSFFIVATRLCRDVQTNHIIPLYAKAAQSVHTNPSPTYIQRTARSLRAFRLMIGLAGLLLAAGPASATVLTEDFDVVAPRPSQPYGETGCPQAASFLASGWLVLNKSAGLDGGGPSARCVTQGFPDIPFYYDPALSFSSQDGQAFAYAGFPSRAAPTPAQAAILWLVSPQVDFGVGGSLSFWTRRVNDGNAGADRLQVRTMLGELPATGNYGDVSSVGGFNNLLLDMNPTGTAAGYICPLGGVVDPPGKTLSNIPWADWCHVTLTAASGLPTSGRGFIAFRYYAPATGTAPFPHVAAIDTFRFDPGTIPAVPPVLAYGLAPGSILTGTGTGQVGASVFFGIPVTIGTPGSGIIGPETTTTLQCAPVSAPFAGFDPNISVQPDDTFLDGALTGSCIQQNSVATQTLHCTETRGAQSPIAIDYQLRCPGAFGAQAEQRYASAVRADDPALYWRLDEFTGAASNAATGPSSIGVTGNGGVDTGIEYRRDALLSCGTPAGSSYGFFQTGGGRVTSGVFEKLRTNDDGFSLEAWLRFTTISDYLNIMGDRPNDLGASTVFLYLLPSRQLRLHLSTQDGLHAIDTVDGLEPNRAYHLVATWTAATGQLRLYVDGNEVPTVATTGSNPTSGLVVNDALNPIMIGSDLFETTVGADVRIDEAAFYTHVLDPARIRLHYELGTLFGDGFGD